MAKLHRLMPGTEFANTFVVDRVIGEGAMGTVYLAKNKTDGQHVAVKVLKPSIADDDRAAARFNREAMVGSRIGNPHVVDVRDAGFDEETGLHWLSMEYLDSVSLTAYVEERHPSDVVRKELLRHLFDAMAAAHLAGVLHRDLKPENVVVADEDDGTPLLKVLDFGVAKTLGPQMAASATEGGLGTPLWTAPEQGKSGTHIRPTADVWALGLLTFFILSGKMYWKHANDKRASMLDIAQEMLQAAIVVPSIRATELDVKWPGQLDDWFMKCVNRNVDERYVDADVARRALFPLLELTVPTGLTMPPPPPPSLAAPPAPSNARFIIVAVAIAASVVIAGVLLLSL